MDSDELYQELDGPEEGDYILSPAGQLGACTAVTVYGESFLGEFSSEHYPCEEFPDIETADGAALAFIRARMEEEQFWPNVWRADDHGGYTLLTLE